VKIETRETDVTHMTNPSPPPAAARPESVLIDGVRYVPVAEASPSVAALEDAIIEQWAGAGWRASYPDAPGYLRVIVSDTTEDGEGETVADFLARLVQGLSGGAR
jgi:hypothetical protein